MYPARARTVTAKAERRAIGESWSDTRHMRRTSSNYGCSSTNCCAAAAGRTRDSKSLSIVIISIDKHFSSYIPRLEINDSFSTY